MFVLFCFYYSFHSGKQEAQKNGHLQRSMSILVSYLDQKQAAGLISLPDDTKPLANLNIFTPSSAFAKRTLEQLLPTIDHTSSTSTTDFLIMVLIKTTIATTPTTPTTTTTTTTPATTTTTALKPNNK